MTWEGVTPAPQGWELLGPGHFQTSSYQSLCLAICPFAVVFFIFAMGVSLCIPGWSETGYVNQTDPYLTVTV